MPAGAKGVTVDASVALPLVLRNHEAHAAVTRWRADRALSLCGHAWIETYAVLTRLPGTGRVLPVDALALLTSNFSRPLSPKPDTLARAIELFASAGIAGGATYDGWVALAALHHGARLASRDARAEGTYRGLGVNVEMIG